MCRRKLPDWLDRHEKVTKPSWDTKSAQLSIAHQLLQFERFSVEVKV
jgi:hypothetical protein